MLERFYEGFRDYGRMAVGSLECRVSHICSFSILLHGSNGLPCTFLHGAISRLLLSTSDCAAGMQGGGTGTTAQVFYSRGLINYLYYFGGSLL